MTRAWSNKVTEARGTGEQLERARRRRKQIIIGGIFIVGFIGGIITGFTQVESLLEGTGTWPAPLSIGLACAYLAAVVGGGIAMSRQSDEFEIQARYKSASLAAGTYAIVYPPWFLLWMADLVREPMHGVLFILFWVALAVSSIFYSFR